jgi:hypothetical protein
MGRPLHKKYFGNRNTGGTGGEGVASVTVVAGDSADYDAADTVAFSAPQITGGVRATGTLVLTDGAVTGVTVTNRGSGYTSAPTLTITTSTGTQTTLTLTAVLTSGNAARENAIKCETQYGSSGNEITTGDIVKQVGAKRFKVQSSEGTGVFKLVTTEAKNSMEMSIKATDSAGGTYLVRKISNHKVTLVPVANAHGGTSSAGSQFASGTTAKWTFGNAVANTTVKLDNQ